MIFSVIVLLISLELSNNLFTLQQATEVQHCDVSLLRHERLGAGRCATAHLATELATPDPHAADALPITLKKYDQELGEQFFDIASTEGVAARAEMGPNPGFVDVLYPADTERRQIPFEHVDGRLLEVEIRINRLLLRRALLAMAVGDSLYPNIYDAGERGVVPCDFKPENTVCLKSSRRTFDTRDVLGTRRSTMLTIPTVCKVIDLDNVVRIRRDGKYDIPTVLSALYVAPEQARDKPDKKSALFVLGTILQDILRGSVQRIMSNGRTLTPQATVQHIATRGFQGTGRAEFVANIQTRKELASIEAEIARLTTFMGQLHEMDPERRPEGRDAFREQVINGSGVLRKILEIEE